MSITRRFFISGLAAVLSVIRIPGVLASEEMDMPEDEYDDDDYGPSITYLEVGECEDMLGGPATEPGWYLHPTCRLGCCKSDGPFPSREAALEADRIRWDEIAQGIKAEENWSDAEREADRIRWEETLRDLYGMEDDT